MSSDFGRTVLTLGGQVLGFFVGGPIGAAIGSYLGASLGSALFPLDPAEGQRLQNPQITSASYGTPIPEVFGLFRVGGLLIDASEIREVAIDTEVGGKGGAEQTVRTYEYYADVCLLLCRGQIVGVRRIWANGKLIFDASDTADALTLMASGRTSESIRVYTGTEEQQPDPTFEALRGVGNVPAYRGIAYVVLENLRLESGTVPSFQVEVFTAGSFGIGAPKLVAEQTSAVNAGFPAPITEISLDSAVVNHIVTPGGADVGVLRIHAGAAAPERIGYFNVPNLYIQWRPAPLKTRSGGLVAGFFSTGPQTTNNSGIAVYGIDGTPVFTYDMGNYLTWEYPGNGYDRYITFGAGVIAEENGIYVASTRQWKTVDDTTENNYHRKRVRVWQFGGGIGTVFDLPADHYTVDIDILAGQIYVLAARRDSATQFTYRLLRFSIGGSLVATADIGLYGHGSTSTYPRTAIADPVFCGSIEIDRDGVANVLILGLQLAPGAESSGLQVWRVSDSGQARLLASGMQPTTLYLSPAISMPAYRFRVTPAGVLVGIAAIGGGPAGLQFISFASASPGSIALSSVVQSITARAGVASTVIDTAQLTGTVTGFAHAGGQPLRAALEPLMQSFFFSTCDVDGKLVCVPRGGAVELALAADDLVRDDDTGETVIVENADEAELPVQVSVGYVHADTYESGQQPARKQNTASIAVDQITLPLVLTDDAAAKIADKRLGALWAGATRVRFAVPLKHLAIAPGAVITVPRRDRTLRLAVTRTTIDGARLAVEAVSEAQASFTSYATGQAASQVPQTVDFLAQSTLAAMDVPILRAGDDGIGFYLAAAPLASTSGWQGAQIYRSIEGTAYAPLATVTQAATMGRTETALPAWRASEERSDVFVTLDVALPYGALASATEADPHTALVGAELIRFVTVTQLGPGRYRLGRIRRGVQGTQHLTASHAVGEPFVLLSAAVVRRVDDEASTLDVQQRLRAVTFGRTLAEAPEFALTNTGRRRQCLPPLGLTASPQANGDTVFTWRRAVRKYANTRNLTVTGIEESPARSYELDLVDVATGQIVRTLAANNAEQITYTAAAATADWGGTEFGARVQAYQLNGAGRGLPGSFFVSTATRGPIPALLINCSDEPIVAGRIATQMPIGVEYQRFSEFDASRKLYGERSLKGPGPGLASARGVSVGFDIGTGDWYVGVWVYLPAIPSVNYYLASQFQVGGQRTFRLGIEGGLAVVRTSGDGSNTLVTLAEPAASLVAGHWNHVAASRQGSTLRLFVNGSLRASSAGATAQYNAPGAELFVAYNGSPIVDLSAYNVQEVVAITGAAYRTASFSAPRAPYWFR